jgi:hypothetical protein
VTGAVSEKIAVCVGLRYLQTFGLVVAVYGSVE